MRALIVTNLYPTPARPELGSFVRDQVLALRRIEGVEVELFTFEPGLARGYLQATAAVRGRYRGAQFDVVHAHFGLCAWPALAAGGQVHGVTLHGTDLAHPRSRAITLAALRFLDLVAVVSEQLRSRVPGWAVARTPAILPCGVDLERFHPIPRAEAREALGLEPDGPYLLFAADPQRPEKRHDLARVLAGDTRLLTLGGIVPEQVPLWVNAANAVLVTSEREGFGLAVLEALACNVPVLATPWGIAPEVLDGLGGCYCAPFDRALWREALAPHLAVADPRVDGRARVQRFSSDAMAARVVAAWRAALDGAG